MEINKKSLTIINKLCLRNIKNKNYITKMKGDNNNNNNLNWNQEEILNIEIKP